MLEVECDACHKRFFVKGHTTPDGFFDPGEVVTALESDDELCECLNNGNSYSVVDESHESFPDDVI